MSLSENDINLIEKYLDNDLSESEESSFKKRLSDVDFKNELELHKTAADGIRSFHRNALKDELKGYLRSDEGKRRINKETKHRNIRHYYSAAAVSVILVFTAAMFFLGQEKSPDDLFSEYYSPYPVTSVTRGIENSQESEAFQLYQAGEYEQAAGLLKNIVAAGTDNSFIRVLLGNCYINTNDYEAALRIFDEIVEADRGIFANHAQWYSALVYVKKDDPEKAVTILEEIQNSNSIYSENAGKLIGELK